MDRVTALIAIAHMRLRLEMLARSPQILETTDMDIRRPMELAGLKSRLARAKNQETAIANTGKRFDAVLDRIDELHGAAQGHVGQLEGHAAELAKVVDGMIARDNGDPNDEGSGSSDGSSTVGQVISSEASK